MTLASAFDFPLTAPWQVRRVTQRPINHILTNTGCWSPDGQWILYDLRSDLEGTLFDSPAIERVHSATGEVESLFLGKRGAKVGVVTHSPCDGRIVFIHGPAAPTSDWAYSATHRHGCIVDSQVRPPRLTEGGVILDARDLAPPFTSGALRGGTHLHTFSGDGHRVSSTYQDAVLEMLSQQPTAPIHDLDQRNVAVSVRFDGGVVPKSTHPHNQSGAYWTTLVTHTVNHPQWGSDEICRAFSDAWIGQNGYLRADGSRQHYAIAFQGELRSRTGVPLVEAFVVDLPDDEAAFRIAGDLPLQGTPFKRPAPPAGIAQRRISHTESHRFPGLAGPRHWPRSSPDGSRIALLKRDETGVVQIWLISPLGGDLQQLTSNPHDIASAFSWSPNGAWISHVMGGEICVTNTHSGKTHALTDLAASELAPSPLACVFSPCGTRIAYLQPRIESTGETVNHIALVESLST